MNKPNTYIADLETMTLTPYTDDSTDATTAEATVTVVTAEIVRGVVLGDVYRGTSAGITTEAWPFEREGNLYRAMLTVEHQGKIIASRVIAVPDTFFSGMDCVDWQDPRLASERPRMIVNA